MLAMPSLKDCLKVLKQYLLFPSLIHSKNVGDFNLNKRKPIVESMGIYAKQSLSSRSNSLNERE